MVILTDLMTEWFTFKEAPFQMPLFLLTPPETVIELLRISSSAGFPNDSLLLIPVARFWAEMTIFTSSSRVDEPSLSMPQPSTPCDQEFAYC